jgi:hypothetical protein
LHIFQLLINNKKLITHKRRAINKLMVNIDKIRSVADIILQLNHYLVSETTRSNALKLPLQIADDLLAFRAFISKSDKH